MNGEMKLKPSMFLAYTVRVSLCLRIISVNSV